MALATDLSVARHNIDPERIVRSPLSEIELRGGLLVDVEPDVHFAQVPIRQHASQALGLCCRFADRCWVAQDMSQPAGRR